MQQFFLADEKHQALDGSVVEYIGVLYFKQDSSGFAGKATKEHVAQYPGEFAEFQAKYPDYVLPDSFTTPELEIGSPVATPQPPPEEEVIPPPESEGQEMPETEAEKRKFRPDKPEFPHPEQPEVDPPEATQLPAEDSWPHKKY